MGNLIIGIICIAVIVLLFAHVIKKERAENKRTRENEKIMNARIEAIKRREKAIKFR